MLGHQRHDIYTHFSKKPLYIYLSDMLQQQELYMESEQNEMQPFQESTAMGKISSVPPRVPFGSNAAKDTTMAGADPKSSLLKKKYSRNPFKWVSHRSSNDAPKRPMSSYNMFFLLERERIIRGETERPYGPEDVQQIVELQKIKDMNPKRSHRKSHGIISFHDLSRVVARRWKTLDDAAKEIFNQQANVEKMVYKRAMDEWVLTKMRGVSSSQPPSHSTDESNGKISSSMSTDSNPTKVSLPFHHGMQVNRFFQRCVSNESSSARHPSLVISQPPKKDTSSLDAMHQLPIFAVDHPHHSLELLPSPPPIALHHVATHDGPSSEWPRIGDGPLWYDPAVNCSAELLEPHGAVPRWCLQCRAPGVEPPDFYCAACLRDHMEEDEPMAAAAVSDASIEANAPVKSYARSSLQMLENVWEEELGEMDLDDDDL
jgi:HMG-box domain